MKKASLLLVVLLTSVLSGLKANQVTDSLEILLTSMSDTGRVKVLCDLCWEYRFISADQAMQYGQEALSLSEKIKWNKRVLTSHAKKFSEEKFKKEIMKFVKKHARIT